MVVTWSIRVVPDVIQGLFPSTDDSPHINGSHTRSDIDTIHMYIDSSRGTGPASHGYARIFWPSFVE